MGRCLVAAEDAAAGAVLLRERPAAAVLLDAAVAAGLRCGSCLAGCSERGVSFCDLDLQRCSSCDAVWSVCSARAVRFTHSRAFALRRLPGLPMRAARGERRLPRF